MYHIPASEYFLPVSIPVRQHNYPPPSKADFEQAMQSWSKFAP